jgi:dTDP-4-dehydrorhamnose 3,5-epimerase
MIIKKSKINGLELFSLRQIVDERGAVYHYLKSTTKTFKGFGEAYFSKINSGIVKGWKLHENTHQHFCVPYGIIKIVLIDDRIDSITYGNICEIILDDSINYKLLSIPPGLWYSFKCLTDNFTIISNIIDIEYEFSNTKTLPIDSKKIPYTWK